MRTVILIGNGAVEYGWDPVRDAVRSVGDFDRLPSDCDSGLLNQVFADLVYKLNWISAKRDQPRGVHVFDGLVATYRQFQAAIADRLERATSSGRLSLRSQFDRLVDGEVYAITTNWDTTLDRDGRFGRSLLHLHGSAANPESLYFPTEGIEQPYLPEEQRHKRGTDAGMAMKALERAERLVVYGLSLSPLDAELGVVLQEGFTRTSNPREVVIVDPSWEAVAQRLRYYLPSVSDVRGVHPDELG